MLISTQVIALSLACFHWNEIGGEDAEKGIFEYTLEFCVLSNAKGLGQSLLACWTSTNARWQRGLGSHGDGPETDLPSPPRRDTSDRSSMAAAAAERRVRAALESEIL